MRNNPLTGAGYFLRGFMSLGRPGLRRFVALPLLVNVLVFSLLIWLAVGEFDQLVHSLMPDLPGWLEWLAWLLWLVFALVVVGIVFFTFTIIANLIGAPFNGLLAEAVERQQGGLPAPDAARFNEMVKAIPAILWDELGKLTYFAAWAVPLLLLFWVPLINLAAPLFWTLFSVWMLAVEYSDYPMSNHGLKGKEVRAKLREKRLLVLGFGAATLLATMVPLLNFFVMPAAVIGATLMWLERIRPSAPDAP